MRWLDDITDSMDMNSGKFWEMVKGREPWRAAVHGSQRVGHDLATEQQQQQWDFNIQIFGRHNSVDNSV